MITLFNTLSHKIENFKPLKKGKVNLYTCGPTVYNYAHIGNLRTYVFEDILKRVFKFNGYKIKHVMNITDVGHLTSDADEGEDKMEREAARAGKSAWEIASFYTIAFRKDLAELNISEPNIWCRATEHIKEQIKLIKKLERKGFTYKTLDGIYFDTSKLTDYGKLANLKKQELRAGVRISMGAKKNPTDFALWKFSPPLIKRQMEWESPWGIGFPGWHIECSAMAEKYLGQPFDIHCGGIDHIPVHHTNEIAQSEAANGRPLANYWLHGEFLLTGDAKMAKSERNFITLQTIKDRGISPLAYRYLLLQTHYRKQLTFSWEALQAAQNGLNNFYEKAKKLSDNKKPSSFFKNKFLEKINNDLDVPGALSWVWQGLKDGDFSLETLYKFDEVLGLQIKEQEIKNKNETNIEIPSEVKKLITERAAARAEKNWTKSDELRDELEKSGYVVKDTKDGMNIIKK
ncbi:MAG: cysteine--tRNA ligase [Candidatus Magasanikbacteria bacterium]